MAAAPWEKPKGTESVVRAWLASGVVKPCLAAERLIEERPAVTVPLPPDLSPEVRRALASRSVTALYSHQAEAIAAARGGRHVVVATPTASGKSVCFNVPVLEALRESPAASALYLFPTKALSRDQEHGILEMVRAAGLSLPAAVYDGDTPGDARRAARERSRIVLTNPDMLHAGILPNHVKWASFFQGLRYVVLDELHTYRGVFGSHMAHVVARLRRLAAFHGAQPTFVCATATIGNPGEHAARLLGVPKEDVVVVDRSGAPSASRRFFLYNPPVVNEELGVRGSSLKHAVGLTADLVRARVPSIVFGQSRNSVETMLKYLREECHGEVPENAIMAYRGGYLPQTRRKIEEGLRNGEVLCVVATNALELGIDIGDLDAVVCVGYPGSVAATWQRFGRAGRRGSQSIALMVCGSNALDQFLAREPDYLLRAGAEEARIDPGNVEILVQHLKCATFEAPFEISGPGDRVASPDSAVGESYGTLDASATRDALEYLVSHGLVHESRGRYHWIGDPYPATNVSLRTVGWDNFVIVDLATDESIAELDFRAAHTMLHEQAIYQHDAEQYQVEKLDFDDHKAFVRKVAPDYFTTALTYRTVEVLEESASRSLARAVLGFGEVKVIERVTGYKKVKFFTHENAGYGDVHLPEMQMHTTSFWLTIPEPLVESLGAPRAEVVEALRGAGVALETVATLALMCEPSDVSRTLGDGEGESGRDSAVPAGRNPHAGRTGGFDPTLFLFDAVPGGVGLAARIYERADELVGRARDLIATCRCEGGCPACIGPGEAPGRKDLAVRLLGRLTDLESSTRQKKPD
ncbi:MAG TPA: DEAD/DEAH box helicase [Polyangiaceae bacterium]|nr:DEAD/DEAH box helicase [Polyangiaceae bacterium]